MGSTLRVIMHMRERTRESHFLHVRKERDFPLHQIPAQWHKYSIFSDLKVRIKLSILVNFPVFHVHMKIIQQASSLGKVTYITLHYITHLEILLS